MTTAIAELPRLARRRLPLDMAAVSDSLPLLAALAPFALVIGVATTHGVDGVAAGLSGGPLLYGGSAQLSAMQLLDGGASVLGAVAAVALINARFLVYSAALAPSFAGQPGWFRWAAPYFIVEPTFAVTAARHDLDDPRRFRSYWMTAGVVIGVWWCGTMAVGALAGPVVPHVPAIAFLPIAAFLTMLAPQLTSRPAVVAAAAAAVVAVATPVPAAVRVLLAVVVGSLTASMTERRTT